MPALLAVSGVILTHERLKIFRLKPWSLKFDQLFKIRKEFAGARNILIAQIRLCRDEK